ncbi:MAG TPA: redoxin domain-containing protein [Chloroflexota bacterium]|jgi:thiol-disulfide isomerase/thioredoxin|nr:redoxin domain-containing protein [Chloroflexota bacterium]
MTNLRKPRGCWLLLVFPLIGLALVALAIGVTPAAPTAEVAPLVVDKPAPDLSARTLDGATLRLSELRGRAIALNFWATWCEPCRTEMPALQNASAAEPSLMLLAVNAGEPADNVRAFNTQYGLSLITLLDPDSVWRDRFGVRVLPTTIWVDKQGIVRVKHIGALTPALIERYVHDLTQNS